MRSYRRKLYHPRNWRTWQDFGTGQLGDFGCHILDPVFQALDLTVEIEDCDDDASNGCEIPTGVPNVCDADGLNANGCWTAHCGSSMHVDARNFGTWYCFECTNCTEMGSGIVAWCSHSSGLWFPAEEGSCVVSEIDYTDLVCAP